MPSPGRLVLGSRSAWRLNLLKQVFPADAIDVVPPRSHEEIGFQNCGDWTAIEQRLREVAREKFRDVLEQLAASRPANPPGAALSVRLVTADTVIVVRDADGHACVLGRPPEDDSWRETVAGWFRTYYAGRTHRVATAVCVGPIDAGPDVAGPPRGTPDCRVVVSEVTFRDDVDRWLDWYLATGESRGKAGGYAIQGIGSLFVARVEGSLSNVVGLPLAEVLELLAGDRGPAPGSFRGV